MLILLIHNNKVGHRINKWVAESTKWVTESTKWVTESTNGVITESTKWVWGTVSAMERERGGISMLVAATGKPITSLRIGREPGYRARAYKNFI